MQDITGQELKQCLDSIEQTHRPSSTQSCKQVPYLLYQVDILCLQLSRCLSNTGTLTIKIEYSDAQLEATASSANPWADDLSFYQSMLPRYDGRMEMAIHLLPHKDRIRSIAYRTSVGEEIVDTVYELLPNVAKLLSFNFSLGASKVARMVNLTSISAISLSKYMPVANVDLSKLHDLCELDLFQVAMTSETAQSISRLPYLRRVRISQQPNINSQVILPILNVKLRELAIDNCKIQQDLVKLILQTKALHGLTCLSISEYVPTARFTTDCMQDLVRFIHLRQLKLSSQMLGDGILPLLAHLPVLELLFIDGNRLTNLTQLQNLPHLKYLNVSRNQLRLGCFQAIRSRYQLQLLTADKIQPRQHEDCRCISDLAALKELSCCVDGSHTAWLGKLCGLRKLNYKYLTLGSDLPQALIRLSGLRQLDLRRQQTPAQYEEEYQLITLACIRSISSMLHLEILRLSDMLAEEQCFYLLARLPQLKELTLYSLYSFGVQELHRLTQTTKISINETAESVIQNSVYKKALNARLPPKTELEIST